MWRLAFGLWAGLSMSTEAQVIDTFGAGAESRWRYIADGVMGGVSTGTAALDGGALRLAGTVSTKNNGGFIQVRRALDGLGGEALVLRVRGNGARYTVFLRTGQGRRPWHNYKAFFTAGAEWSDVRLPFASFERSNAVLDERLDPADVISVGIAAYGTDYEADVWVDEVRAE